MTEPKPSAGHQGEPMTPHIKTIILSNGEVLSDQGVVRCPKAGEWFAGPRSTWVQFAAESPARIDRTILTPLETQGQKIERRSDGEWFSPRFRSLIDAACAVVNRPQIALHFPTEAKPLAAALEPFTRPVKPKDRYYVERRGSSFYVMDAEWQVDYVGKFEREQDAKDFAALKNGQEGQA